MGATKRLCEIILQSMNKHNKTKFTIVRFGNVLGSSGSVVPLFEKQINEGGPVTVTDLETDRYFMTITEASQLLIQAATLSQGGEIFLLDMGQPIKIIDLAKRMIKLMKGDHKHIEIKITGMRPGERIHEQLLINNTSIATLHPKIFIADDKFNDEKLQLKLERLYNSVKARDREQSLMVLKSCVPEYSYQTPSVDWVTKN